MPSYDAVPKLLRLNNVNVSLINARNIRELLANLKLRNGQIISDHYKLVVYFYLKRLIPTLPPSGIKVRRHAKKHTPWHKDYTDILVYLIQTQGAGTYTKTGLQSRFAILLAMLYPIKIVEHQEVNLQTIPTPTETPFIEIHQAIQELSNKTGVVSFTWATRANISNRIREIEAMLNKPIGQIKLSMLETLEQPVIVHLLLAQGNRLSSGSDNQV